MAYQAELDLDFVIYTVYVYFVEYNYYTLFSILHIVFFSFSNRIYYVFTFHTAIADFFQCLYKSDQRSMRCNNSVENKSRMKRSLENGCCWCQSDQLPILT